MPGRRRVQITATASSGEANAIRALMSAALNAQTGVHAVDRAPLTEPVDDPAPGRTHRASMDVRLEAGQPAAGFVTALRAVGNGRSARVEIVEHECFHVLEDDPDFKPCVETLTRWLEVDGVEQTRGGRNGE